MNMTQSKKEEKKQDKDLIEAAAERLAEIFIKQVELNKQPKNN